MGLVRVGGLLLARGSRRAMSSSVAACIIATEVLNGKTTDTNSAFLARQCFEHGLDLKTIRVIPDDDGFIQQTVGELCNTHDLVFTSGGIGPTHDDITYPAISAALGRPLLVDQSIVNRMRQHLKLGELNEGQRRMAQIPQPDRIIFTPGLWVPLVQVRNVLILPGVPRLFQAMLAHWMGHCLGEYGGLRTQKCLRRQIRTHWPESELAPKLSELQDQVASRGIQLGSYPSMKDPDNTFVAISIVGPEGEAELVEQTRQKLKDLFQGQDHGQG